MDVIVGIIGGCAVILLAYYCVLLMRGDRK